MHPSIEICFRFRLRAQCKKPLNWTQMSTANFNRVTLHCVNQSQLLRSDFGNFPVDNQTTFNWIFDGNIGEKWEKESSSIRANVVPCERKRVWEQLLFTSNALSLVEAFFYEATNRKVTKLNWPLKTWQPIKMLQRRFKTSPKLNAQLFEIN